MVRLPTSHGVCIKPAPEVERYLLNLDDCRSYLIHLKISNSISNFVPGEPYSVAVKLSKSKEVIFTCISIVEPTPEVLVLSCEERRITRWFIFRWMGAASAVTLLCLELLYYGGHAVPVLKTVARAVLVWFGFGL